MLIIPFRRWHSRCWIDTEIYTDTHPFRKAVWTFLPNEKDASDLLCSLTLPRLMGRWVFNN